MVHIGTILAVPDVLRHLGSNPDKVLAEVGVDPSLFDDPNNQIPFSERGRMMAHCAKRTACPHFGLLVGQRAGLRSFGLVGLLSKFSVDIGTALTSLVRFMHLHVKGATTFLWLDSGLATLEYQIYEPHVSGNEQVGDGAVAIAFNIIRELSGNNWNPVEVRFAHRSPRNTTPYHQFFHTPLQFDAGEYSVVFPASLLQRPLPENDPELRRLLQQEVDRLEAQENQNFDLHLRSVLRSAIVSGHSSATEVANLLSINRRTLNHRLKPFGTNFHQVADEVRFEIARQLLEDSSMEVSKIASLLSYSNASAFIRAFRRWSDTTPANWRVMNRRG